IMTGAPIPDGADAIVMVELTEAATGDDTVLVKATVPPGNHVRAAGEDLSPGDEVVPAFTTLTPGHLGLLATIGARRVPVFPRARVVVLSTGDELVDGSAPLQPGQIRDANRHALVAMVREAGADPVDAGIVGDDVDAVRKAIAGALDEGDAVITSGGVSMGAYDPVKVVLRELAGSDTSMQVAIKPAKPLSFGVVDGKPVFGLPGNPASSMVSFELFARPALRTMMGHANARRRELVAVAPEGFPRRPDGKTHLVRVALAQGEGDALVATSAGGQGSNLLRSMAAADGLALVEDGDGVAAGGRVRVLLLRDPL
ncbi:MAG TPA: gephyrin-like molybdotransferase Glp, partial [Acidimicrobiales bacterium]